MQKSDFREKQKRKLDAVLKEIIGLTYQKSRAMEKYDALIADACGRKEKLLKIEYINKKDSFSAISYLVSKMEGIDCSVLEIPIMLYEQNIVDGKGSFQEYVLVCLVFDDNKELALDEIKKRFSCEFISNSSLVYGNMVNSFLSVPSDNYIQLAYYKKDEESKDIRYSYDDKDFSVTDSKEKFISSKICDERYFYIIDYINNVIGYRLDKYDDINFFEMRLLADVYVKNHKKNNGSIKCLVNHNN